MKESNIAGNKTYQNPVSINMNWEEYSLTSLEFLPKMYNLNLILRKKIKQTQTERHSTNNWPGVIKVMKDKERQGHRVELQQYMLSVSLDWILNRSKTSVGKKWMKPNVYALISGIKPI